MSRISVIIPTYNHARFVAQAIESVLAQTLPPQEIFVVDDGSTDDTHRVLKPFANRVCVVRQANRGVSAARNAGIELATGDLIAFLDADDIWFPTKLERQMERFEANPEIGLVHCGTEEIDANGKRIGQSVDGMEGWVADDLLLFRRAVILGGGSGAMFSRASIDEVGEFDTGMSTSADWDFHYRIARRYKVAFVTEVLLQYRLHATNMHGNIRAMEHDMLLAYAKAFNSGDAQLDRLRRRSYGNLHSVLAGSFFSAGQYLGFVEHALKSLLLTPGNISQFAGYPVRQWRRHKSAKLPLPLSDSSEPLNSQ